MNAAYWSCLLLAACLLIYVHTHTDELPFVLGTVLIVCGLVALIFPKRFPITVLLLGAAVFVAETLVHFSILRAPYPASAGIPWVALVAYVPAVIGTAVGTGIRRLMQ